MTLRVFRQLRLELLPLGHPRLRLSGQVLLLLLDFLDLLPGGFLEVGGVAEDLVDLVDPGLGVFDLGGQVVGLLAQPAAVLVVGLAS